MFASNNSLVMMEVRADEKVENEDPDPGPGPDPDPIPFGMFPDDWNFSAFIDYIFR